MLEVVARNPDHVALCLDEGSAIVVHGDGTVEAMGEGGVLVVDGHDLRHASLPVLPRGPVALEHVIVHVLLDGCRYDLAQRRYAPPAGSREKERAAPPGALA